MLDRVVSSYTPTLRALLHARAIESQVDPAQQRMHFVGLAETPGQADLPNVKNEESLLRSLFSEDK